MVIIKNELESVNAHKLACNGKDIYGIEHM